MRARSLQASLLGAGILMLGPWVGAASAQTATFWRPVSFDQPNTSAPALSMDGLTFDDEVAADLSLPAQDPAPEPTKRTRSFVSALGHNLLDDVKHLPRRNSLYFLIGGGAAALAVHPADLSINRHLLGSPFADAFFAPGKYVGATEVQITFSFVTYVIGRMRNQTRVEHIGMDMLEAQILTEGIIEAAKYSIRRPRPLNPDGTRFAGYSFPSGHSAVTFATATVFQQHFGWRFAVPTYILATYVATSRLHDNEHYASDVAFGAATGIIIGRSVTWHGRNSFKLAMVGLPGGIGGAITF